MIHCEGHCGLGFGSKQDRIIHLLLAQLEQGRQIMSGLDNLKAADAALKDEVATFLTDIAGKLGDPDADVQAVADDINAEVAALQAGDPATVVTPPTPAKAAAE